MKMTPKLVPLIALVLAGCSGGQSNWQHRVASAASSDSLSDAAASSEASASHLSSARESVNDSSMGSFALAEATRRVRASDAELARNALSDWKSASMGFASAMDQASSGPETLAGPTVAAAATIYSSELTAILTALNKIASTGTAVAAAQTNVAVARDVSIRLSNTCGVPILAGVCGEAMDGLGVAIKQATPSLAELVSLLDVASS